MPKRSETHALSFDMDQAIKAIGAQLSRARRARGDTQAVAAQRCGVHAQTIARIEQGDASVSVGKLFSLLHLYDMGPRVFDLAKPDEATEILYRHHLPKKGRS